MGRAIDAERWAAAVDRTEPVGQLADGSTMESYFAYMRALLGRDGVESTRRDAELAARRVQPREPVPPDDDQRAGMCLVIEGELEAATPVLAHACDAAMQIGAVPFAAMILAERAAVAIELDDWTEAAVLSDRAEEIVRCSELDDYWTERAGVRFAARVALRRGRTDRAAQLAARTTRLRPLLTSRIACRLGADPHPPRLGVPRPERDGRRARCCARRATILQQRPKLGNLSDRTDELSRMLDGIRAGSGARR